MPEARPKIVEIVFPTDLSAASEAAFQHARLWAERFQARLTLYHAIEIPTVDYARWGADHDVEIRTRYEQAARREIARRFASGSVPQEVVVERDVAAPSLLVDVALLEWMRTRTPDLVVMATHARRGLAYAFIGSVTEQVVHHAGRPVLCVPPRETGEPPAYRRLVVSTDLSEGSRRAFPWAAGVGAAFGTQVVAVHVPPRPAITASMGLGSSLPAVTADEVQRFVAPDLGGSMEVRVGAPARAWEGIVRAAEQEKADLIVISRRGQDEPGRAVLGSVTDRVIRYAHCPVLVV